MKGNNSHSRSALGTLISLIILSGVLVFYTYFYAIDFSAFSIGIAKFVIGVILIWVVDKFAVPEVDTMKLLKEDPRAYAMFLLGLFILASLSIGNS